MITLLRTTRRLVAALPFLLVPLALRAHPALAQDSTPASGVHLSLGEAARLGARQGALAQTARFRADQAEARVRQRRADFLPNLSAAASQGDRTFNTATLGLDIRDPITDEPTFDPNGQVLGPITTVDVRGRASQTLLDAAAVQRYRAARSGARASDADAEAAAEQAGAAAATAYLRTLRAEAQLAARAADSALAGDLLRIARDQLQAGVGVALDVTRAQAQAASVQAQLIAARNERDRAQLELRRTLGLSLDTELALTDTLERVADEAVPSEGDAVERALRTRPDLRAADEQLRAAERQTAAVRAERLPTLGLFGDQGITGREYDHLKSTFNWGVQISLPIFDGFRREGRIDEQAAVAREIDVRRRDLRQQTAVEVRGALLDLASAREQVAAARERLRLAEQEVQQARERFTTGVAGNADVISASLDLNSSRNLVIDALTQYRAAQVSLARAQGTVRALP